MNLLSDPLSLDIVLFIGALSVCALFAFMETSITAMRLFKLKEIAHSIKGYSSLFNALEYKPQVVLITILIMTNMASITCAILAEHLLRDLLGKFAIPETIAVALGICITTIVVSILGEIIPKSIAQSKGTKTFTSILWIINIFHYIFSPLSSALNNLAHYLSTHDETDADTISEKEIQFLISHIQDKGIMENEKTEMLQNIFRMAEMHVKEILIPKSEIVSLNINSDIKTLLQAFVESKFSRFPVYQDNSENIIGIIYLKDLFLALEQQDNASIKLQDLVRPIIFVPDSLKVSEVLKEFKNQKIHMAMVIDEYGSTIGLVTLEDALEEIVGDILDEHEKESLSAKITSVEEGVWLVDGSVDIDRLQEILKITFHVETAVTVGGFVTEALQHLPQKNETLIYHGYYFEVTKANAKRVLEVLVRKCATKQECHTN